jgi:hypothetical protein
MPFKGWIGRRRIGKMPFNRDVIDLAAARAAAREAARQELYHEIMYLADRVQQVMLIVAEMAARYREPEEKRRNRNNAIDEAKD